MTTTIKVTSHNYPALVEAFNVTQVDENMTTVEKEYGRVILPEDGEVSFYCTTTRRLQITDIDYEDPRVLARKAEDAA